MYRSRVAVLKKVATLSAVSLILFVSLAASLWGSTAEGTAEQQSPDTTFRVDVKLVNVFVTVQDQNGAPVSSLSKENFRLFEDDHPEKIALFSKESELPLSIVVGIDASLSTKKDLKLELESARRFARSIMRPIDALSLYQFSEVVNEVVPFTSDVRRIDRGVEQVRTGAGTALYDAIFLGSEALQPRKGRKVMVIITDGGDTMSKTNYREAVRAAEEAEAIIYSIVVVPIEADAGRDVGGEHALIEISRQTGGKHYYASSMSTLDRAFQQISEELRTQYLIAYYPSRRVSDSDFRQLHIDIIGTDDANLKARYRSGYYTNAPR